MPVILLVQKANIKLALINLKPMRLSKISFAGDYRAEWEVFNFYNTKHKIGSVFGMGVQYQLSNNLKIVVLLNPFRIF